MYIYWGSESKRYSQNLVQHVLDILARGRNSFDQPAKYQTGANDRWFVKRLNHSWINGVAGVTGVVIVPRYEIAKMNYSITIAVHWTLTRTGEHGGFRCMRDKLQIRLR